MARKNKRAASTRKRKQAQRKARSQETPRAFEQGDQDTIRLNRFIARAGTASRREADTLIEAGRVKVNGKTVTALGTKITLDDDVEVDGHPIRPARLVTYLLNKPRGTITTKDDERGRRTVLDLLDLTHEVGNAIFPVGRLDKDTTGALLLTTDGDLAHRLMHPRYEIDKIYLVETVRPVTPEDVNGLTSGVLLDDGLAKADHAERLGVGNRVALQIHEGRNRQVRRMLEALDHEVVALDRIRYADMTLDGLGRGAWRRLEDHEVNRLRRRVKLKPILY